MDPELADSTPLPMFVDSMSAFTGCAILMAIAVMGLLASEYYDKQAGRWICKPMAALCFLTAAFALVPLRSTYGILICIGLVLSAIGDLCLIPRKSERIFMAGIGAFLLAHVAYGLAFMTLGYSFVWMFLAFFPLAALGVFVFRWLQPDVPPGLQRPVLAYVMVITWMVAMSIGTFGSNTQFLLVPVAAIMFWASDLSVARARFKAAPFSNKAWGIPLYFASQLMFAFTTLFGVKPA